MKRLVAICATLVLAACGGPYQLTAAESNTANLGGLQYANQIGNAKLISCSGQDSDGDSYVTCTLSVNGAEKAILCSYRGSPGCKPK